MTRVELKALVSKKKQIKTQEFYKSIFSYVDNFGCVTHTLGNLWDGNSRRQVSADLRSQTHQICSLKTPN